jgi:hypothetical protein
MRNAPADLAELTALFECEPTLLDPSVSWTYNTLTFETEREGVAVLCCIRPAYATLSVVVSIAGREIAQADLSAFSSLEVVAEPNREMLVARFGEEDNSTLWLMLRPHVRLATSG